MKSEDKPTPNEEKDPFWKRLPVIVPVIVAIFGCIASIVVAFLNAEVIWGFILNKPTATLTSLGIATTPVWTPDISMSPTFAPASTLAVVTPLPGRDWQDGCIDDQWVIYPVLETTVDGSGCYQQPIWSFISTKNGGLYILAQHRNLISAEEYGIFAPLPQSGTVSLKIDLDVIDNGEIWVGIFSKPDIHSYGMLIVVPPGPVKEHAFGVRSMPDQKRMEVTEIYKNKLGIYSLGFDLYKGEVNAITENVVHDDQRLAFPSADRWLFIGYRAKLEIGNGTTDIEALIKDLVITPNY